LYQALQLSSFVLIFCSVSSSLHRRDSPAGSLRRGLSPHRAPLRPLLFGAFDAAPIFNAKTPGKTDTFEFFTHRSAPRIEICRLRLLKVFFESDPIPSLLHPLLLTQSGRGPSPFSSQGLLCKVRVCFSPAANHTRGTDPFKSPIPQPRCLFCFTASLRVFPRNGVQRCSFH